MNNFDLNSFEYDIVCEGELKDTKIFFEKGEKTLEVYITAKEDRPEFVNIRWKKESGEGIFVLGDAWERSYGDLCFLPLEENDRNMPWYFIATNKKESFCFGVKTQPSAFVNFRCEKKGISAKIDCRNGGGGVALGGRKLKLCTFIYEFYSLPPMEALADFCKRMCENPLLPKEKIYGGNNWYFAYGKSSAKEIINNARLQAELSEGIENRPFMVVDDGWQKKSCCGPWKENRKYKDMKKVADEMKSLGVRPGIWVRLLRNTSREVTSDMRIKRNGKRVYLDPTNEKVQLFIRKDIEKIRNWGYELLKHDFSTADLFGSYGNQLSDTITVYDDWHFHDRSKTNAEIVLDFYALIRECCGDMLILGCNTISHLSAGMVHIYRTGDDTSGREWDRTKKMGVNTLAFRLMQNNSFYLVDADCVGIIRKKIPWEKNRQWLDVLAKSNTALFTSCSELTEEEKADIREAYRSIQLDHEIEPVDIFESLTPEKWKINGKIENYNWD